MVTTAACQQKLCINRHYDTSHELCIWFALCYNMLGLGACRFYLYISGLLLWHWGNRTLSPLPVQQPWILLIALNTYILLTHKTHNKTFRMFYRTFRVWDASSHYSLWPSDVIWQHSFGSTLVQVMACCLTAPSHYLKQYCLISSEVFGIHMRAVPEEKLVNLIRNMCSEIEFFL